MVVLAPAVDGDMPSAGSTSCCALGSVTAVGVLVIGGDFVFPVSPAIGDGGNHNVLLDTAAINGVFRR